MIKDPILQCNNTQNLKWKMLLVLLKSINLTKLFILKLIIVCLTTILNIFVKIFMKRLIQETLTTYSIIPRNKLSFPQFNPLMAKFS